MQVKKLIKILINKGRVERKLEIYCCIRDPEAIKDIDYQVHAIMIKLKPTLLHLCCK